MRKCVLALLFILFVSLVLAMQPTAYSSTIVVIASQTTGGDLSSINQVHPATSRQSGMAEAFNQTYADSYFLYKASFRLKKGGSPVGNLSACLYTGTGTYGTTMKPNSSLTWLERSDKLAMSSLTTSYVWYNFTFSSTYLMPFNTQYCIAIIAYEATTLDNSNLIYVNGNTTDCYSGDWSYFYGGNWYAAGAAAGDVAFYVYGESVTAPTPLTFYGSASQHFQTVEATLAYYTPQVVTTSIKAIHPSITASASGRSESFNQTLIGIYVLTKVQFSFYNNVGFPVGNLTARLYDVTGTFGSTMLPNVADTPYLEESNKIDMASINAATRYYNFTFSGTFQMPFNNTYCIVLVAKEATTLDASNYIVPSCSVDGGIFQLGAGNIGTFSSSAWAANAAYDFTFKIYGSPVISSRAWTVDRYGSAAETFTVLGPVSLNIFGAAAQTFATLSQNWYDWMLGVGSNSHFDAYGTGKGWWFIPVVTPTRDPLIYVAIGFGLVALGIAVDHKRRKK